MKTKTFRLIPICINEEIDEFTDFLAIDDNKVVGDDIFKHEMVISDYPVLFSSDKDINLPLIPKKQADSIRLLFKEDKMMVYDIEVELDWNPKGDFCEECGCHTKTPCDNICDNHKIKVNEFNEVIVVDILKVK